jgi:hypothetical protein
MLLMPLWAIAVFEKIMKTAPACFAGIILMGACLYAYTTQNYASAKDLQDLSESIDKNFNVLLTRMNLSDAERVVADVQDQIRQKEKEIADLEMVISDVALSAVVGTGSESQSVLRDRAFVLKQDLSELRGALAAKERDLQRARDALNHATHQP